MLLLMGHHIDDIVGGRLARWVRWIAEFAEEVVETAVKAAKEATTTGKKAWWRFPWKAARVTHDQCSTGVNRRRIGGYRATCWEKDHYKHGEARSGGNMVDNILNGTSGCPRVNSRWRTTATRRLFRKSPCLIFKTN